MGERNRIAGGFKEGIISGLPVVFGYFPVAMAFGLLSKNINVSLLDSCLFSLVVYAGASQFMALDLIKAGVAAGNIILATFLLNLRYLMMSTSLAVKLKEIKKHWLVFIAFGITDETFSITSLGSKKLSALYLLTLHGAAYSSWVAGTVAGYLVGTVLPPSVQSSLGIGLYAMFVALLVPEIKKSFSFFMLSVLSGLIYAAITCFKVLPASWSLMVAVIAASGVGAFFLKDGPGEEGK